LKSSWEREKYRHLHIGGKKMCWMVEDGHLEAEGDEGETLIKVYALYAGRKEG
jgi:hypothetical protein